MNKTHFNVSAIQNKQMKTQLKNALGKYDGISMVNVDMGRSSVEVGYDDEIVDESTIKDCIEKTGCKVE